MHQREFRPRALLAGLGFALSAAIAIGVGGASSLAAAGSTAGGALDGIHLYVVPATGEGEAAVQASGARVIARYDSFSFVSADGSQDGLLRDAGADLRDDMHTVAAADGDLDPGAERALSASGGASLALVQFVGPVKDAWLDTLRKTGATIVTYIAQNGYLVYSSSDETAAVAGLAGDDAVRAVVPFTAADKTAPGIAGSGTVDAAVETLAGAPGEAARDVLAGGRELRAPAAYGGTVTEFAAIDAARVGELARDPAVVSVEPWVEPKLLDERAASIVAGRVNAAGTSLTGPGYLGFLGNQGFPATQMPITIDITDEGLDKGVVPVPPGSHADFYDKANPANPSRIKYAQESTAADANARDCGGHGTNVASIAAGFNDKTGGAFNDGGGFNYGLGIAPRARLGATKIFNCAGSFDVTTSFTSLRAAAYAAGARISNNSWGANVGGAYNADSREFDFLVRDSQPAVTGNQQMVNIFSAGNAGSGANTVGSPGTAKNVITVGASESLRPIGFTDGCGVTDLQANNTKDIIDFSSRGPTDDGRIKPDVVAPGSHVTGAQPQTGADYNGTGTCTPQFPAGSSLYTLVSGTSQAAPEVSGLAALIRDWYGREESAGAAPSPALTKAIMVNTATDEVGGQDGAGGTNANLPTQVQGWGRINLLNVLDGTAREFVDQSSRIGATGVLNRRTYSVVGSGKPLKVSLAWTDAPGPTSGNAFVNDLDLIVHAGGKTYKGNVLSGGQSATGGTADPRNNLENVFLPAGVTGRFAVEVRGTNIAGDGVPGNADPTDQDYALVVSNAAPATGPVLVHDLATATELGGDGDGALEPGEDFLLSERLRNVGLGPATAINGVVAPAPKTTVPVSASPYPDIRPNHAGSNSTKFRVHLRGDYTCGQTAHLKLNLTTAQGSQSVPVDVATASGPGSPTNQDSQDVPKAIPDNNPTGATSSLNVVAAGLVQDINVRVGQITHTFDGDLVISLIGPDNTTVVLANRRGGDGFNYTDTVFDDEAATAIGSGSAPFTGSFRPESPLSVFDGKSVTGTWKLRVADVAAEDAGTLGSWGITRASPTC